MKQEFASNAVECLLREASINDALASAAKSYGPACAELASAHFKRAEAFRYIAAQVIKMGRRKSVKR